MNKVLVVGAGLFGLDVALELDKNGFEVVLVEKNKQILTGTTLKSLLRVHSGLHYPRDFLTAQQSALGYALFRDKYKDCIYDEFQNYYAIAKHNSKTSAEEFENFADKLGFPYHKISKSFNFKPEFNTANISEMYHVKEGVLDIPKLRYKFIRKLNQSSIVVKNQEEVVGIEQSIKSSSWIATIKGTSSSNAIRLYREEFRFVVDATHLTSKCFNLIGDQPNMEYQITHMLNIDYDAIAVGFTVIDGNFLTIQPLIENSKVLTTVYAPLPSVRVRQISKSAPDHWLDANNLEELFSLETAQKEILKAVSEWAPGLLDSKIVSTKTGIRVIESNVRDSDRRRSLVRILAPNLFSIESTKLDHCIKVTEQLVSSITKLS